MRSLTPQQSYGACARRIQDFLEHKKVAIAGASPKKDNFGKYLVTELDKLGNEVYPVNPLYDEIVEQAVGSGIRSGSSMASVH